MDAVQWILFQDMTSITIHLAFGDKTVGIQWLIFFEFIIRWTSGGCFQYTKLRLIFISINDTPVHCSALLMMSMMSMIAVKRNYYKLLCFGCAAAVCAVVCTPDYLRINQIMPHAMLKWIPMIVMMLITTNMTMISVLPIVPNGTHVVKDEATLKGIPVEGGTH